jgi:hypothetical protein
MVDGL